MYFLEASNIIQTNMNSHNGKTNRELIEMLIDQGQNIYAIVADVPRRLDKLEAKFDHLADSQYEMLLELKGTKKQVNNHEFRITKLEAI